jgi:hypothetical protein
MVNQNVNTGVLQKWLVYGILLCRFLVLFIIFALGRVDSLTEDQFSRLLFCVLPVSFLYFALVIRYLFVTKRYFDPGEVVSKSYFVLSYLPLVGLHLVEIMLIIFKSRLFVDIDNLYAGVTGLDCMLAIYAGYHLSSVFIQGSRR